jgi:YbgC/YbaW family acyl-CoA thioester hydrolase
MYEYRVSVEYEDIDSYDIVHHPRVLYYFERARVHYFFENSIDLKKLKYGIVIRDLSIQYKMQMVMHDMITVELRTKNIGKHKFDFDYVIKKDGRAAIKGEIEMVTIDLETKKMIAIPDEMRMILEKIEIKE